MRPLVTLRWFSVRSSPSRAVTDDCKGEIDRAIRRTLSTCSKPSSPSLECVATRRLLLPPMQTVPTCTLLLQITRLRNLSYRTNRHHLQYSWQSARFKSITTSPEISPVPVRRDHDPSSSSHSSPDQSATAETVDRHDYSSKNEPFRRELKSEDPSDDSIRHVKIGDVVRLFLLAKREAWPLTAAFLLLCISSAVALCIPYSIGKILDLAGKEPSEQTIYGFSLTKFGIALSAIFCIGAGANYGRLFVLRIVGERVVARLRSTLYRQTVTQDAEFFDANRVGDLLSRFSSDANIVAKSLTQNISDGLRAVITGMAGLGMMTYVSLELTAIIMAVVPPVAVAAFVYGRKIREITTLSQQALGSSTRVADETLNNIKTVQSFSGAIHEREAKLTATFFSATNLAGNITVLTVLSVGSQMVFNSSISTGDLSSFMMYSAYTGSSMIGLSSFYSKMMKGLGAASRVFALEDSKRSIMTTVGIPATNDAKGAIEFKHVKFAYPTRPSSMIFHDLSFTVPAGSNVCIVGPSGGGKTTINQLLLRFYDPTEGMILLNGKDIKSFNIASLRRAVGVVGQEPVLFSGTIAENIAYGMPRASRQEITDAAKRANCNFIEDFPQRFDTQVGPRGAQLSGGQKQRIAIARALIKQPSILILDEATSSLDAESESAVTDALRQVMQSNDCTTISISHRLAAIRRSDFVIVLDRSGRVAEKGRFQDLVADSESYFMKVLT
ncbi:P-loop containing nucleoside triphosphate hydrolase protein [Lipomyces japonicus]|uniref:P-loop containing nucleoside triphosphate hydrolase protein n=1 Tax=Lipomyces japonicus TaxID=56871 RepID=UPI0034CE5250